MKTTIRTIIALIAMVLTVSQLTACSTSSTSRSAGSELTEQLNIPYDASKDSFVLVVDAITVPRKQFDSDRKQARAVLEQEWKSGGITDEQYFKKAKAVEEGFKNDFTLYNDVLDPLLISSLTGVKNLVVVDKSFARISKNNRVRLPSSYGKARGPYLLRVAITEINQEVESKKHGINTGFSGMTEEDSAAMMLAKFPLALTGFWFTTITNLPSEYRDAVIKGIAGLDVQIIDGKTGRVAHSFPVQGTHTLKLREIGNEYGGGFYSKRSLSSTSTQAVAAALNAAAKRVLEELSNSRIAQKPIN